MAVETFLVLIVRLAAGILAVQSPQHPVSVEDAMTWSAAIAYHAHKSELDPFELVAIARNETDFRPHLVGPDGKDCGMMQTRAKYSRYSCRQLRRDVWLAFSEAARQLSQIRARCEKRTPWDVTRCRLNSYNSGVRYAKKGRPGTYWLRVSCFAAAAREGVVPVGDCRSVRSRGDVARLLDASRRTAAAVARNEISRHEPDL